VGVYGTSLGQPNGTELAMTLTTTIEGPELNRRPEQHQQVGGGGWLFCEIY
jgi:hypothetical protein